MKLIIKVERKEIITTKPDFFTPYYSFRFSETLSIKKFILYKVCKLSTNLKNYYFDMNYPKYKWKYEVNRKIIRYLVYHTLYPYSFSKFSNK